MRIFLPFPGSNASRQIFLCIPLFIIATACQKAGTFVAADKIATSQPSENRLRIAGKPNIVFLLLDDIGYEIPTANGGESYETPNIDQFITEGMNFTQCYGSALCSPSRTMLLTAKYNFRNYFKWGVLAKDNVTMGNMYKDAGYKTCFTGKWQMDGGDSAIRGFGFNKYSVWLPYEIKPEDGGGTRYKSAPIYQDGGFLPPAMVQGTYSADLFNNYALNFIRANRQFPFMLFYSTPLCHKQFTPTPEDPEFNTWDFNKSKSKFFPNMVKYMDKQVGILRDSLRSFGLEDNTIFIILGDNGTAEGIVSIFKGHQVMGDKGQTTTYGTHVPLTIVWPGHIAPGTITNQLVDFTDFVPTLSDLTNIPVPASMGTTDGQSFYPVLTGATASSRDYIFDHFQPLISPSNKIPIRYVQDSIYKLYDDGRFYNMVIDVKEKKPIPFKRMTIEERATAAHFQEILDEMHN